MKTKISLAALALAGAMLAQAVRNTQPELNPVSASAPELKAKRRGRPTTRLPAKPAIKARKGRA